MNKKICVAVLSLLFGGAAHAGPNDPVDASIMASHGSPGGAFVPQPVVPEELKNEGEHFPLSLIVHPLKRGMLVRLPLIDTDPNRGFTFGVLPVWIINASTGD